MNHPRRHPEKSAAEMRQDMEFLRAMFERRQRERAAIDAAIGKYHPGIKIAFWIAMTFPAIASIIYLIAK